MACVWRLGSYDTALVEVRVPWYWCLYPSYVFEFTNGRTGYPCPDGKLKLARRASPEAGQRWVTVLRLV